MTSYKIFLLLTILSFIPLVIGETNTDDVDDIFKLGQQINYAKSCFNNNTYCSGSTVCNFTILYPNKSVFINNIIGSNNIINYNVTFIPDIVGIYNVDMICIDSGAFGSESFKFQTTVSGEQTNLTNGILYSALLGILIFLFILFIFFAERTPKEHKGDEFGNILSINHLRHLRPVLFSLAWGMLLSIVFISSNIALIYLGDSMIGNLLFKLSMILFWISIPAVIIWVMFIFIEIFKDKETKKLLERGIDVQLPV